MKVEIVMIGIGGKNGNVTVIFNLFTSIFRFPSKKCGKMKEQWHLCTKLTVPYPYHFNQITRRAISQIVGNNIEY